ncbi:MAG TPA: HAMP domain-containing sensor histidine kinase [Tabrizicola sp.]|mgnify:CR=1 FL=1|nr:HAMP domain-containing sensor histidine kinase [Tabrizicola sp.]
MPGIDRKWRPSLGQVLGGALLGTLALSFVGLVVLRLIGPVIGYRWGVVLVGGAILLATLVLGFLLLRLLLRPITALAERAGALRRDPMVRAEPLAHYGTRELRDLGASVLDMAGRLQAREATIRSFTDHVTHEMKTPLSAIRAAVELLEDAPLQGDDKALVASIAQAGAQMERQLQALRQAAAAREPGHHGTGRLAEVVTGLQAAHPGLALEVTGAGQPLPLAAGGLTILLQQLLSNAATAGATRVTLVAEPGRLTIQDNGKGISSGNRARVFEPFFTTRRDQGGTGMGLTIATNLLAAHGAEIRLLSPDTGAAFEVLFPG